MITRDAAYWLAPLSLLSLLSYTTHGHLPKGGTTTFMESTLSTNEEMSHRLSTVSLMEKKNPQLPSLLTSDCLCVKLTELATTPALWLFSLLIVSLINRISPSGLVVKSIVAFAEGTLWVAHSQSPVTPTPKDVLFWPPKVLTCTWYTYVHLGIHIHRKPNNSFFRCVTTLAILELTLLTMLALN